MNLRIRKILKHFALAIGYGLLGALVVATGGYIYLLESQLDLKVWHEARLDTEFTAERTDTISTLDAYLETEDRVMQELQTRVYDRIAPADRRDIVRYHSGSGMDPESRPQNWNRTFELAPQRP